MKKLLLGLFLFSLFSCNKETTKKTEEIQKETTFIKIEAVNKDGESTFSKIIIIQ